METAIRAQREKERLSRTGQSDMLRTIFEPITRELKTLQAIEESTTTTTPTAAVPTTAAAAAVTPIRESLPRSATSASSTSDVDGTPILGPSPSSFTVAATPPSSVRPKVAAAAAAATPLGVLTATDGHKDGAPTGSVYRKALELIEGNNHEDGLTGLSVSSGTINGKKYTINAGARAITIGSKTYQIEHPETWILLLAKNPTKYIELTNPKNNRFHPYVKEYQNIASSIGMTQWLRKNMPAQRYQKRKKYLLLLKDLGKTASSGNSSSSGRGFIFSSKPPPPVRDRFLPSDPQGVLRELRKAIAEYEAGNTGMRNIITPLVAQARRMNILPKKMEKSLRGFNWIYT